MRLDVVLERRLRLDLLAAQVAHKVALVRMHRVAVRDLLCLVAETFRAVLALVRQRVVFGRMLIQVLLQLKVGLETLAAQLARKHELLVLQIRKKKNNSVFPYKVWMEVLYFGTVYGALVDSHRGRPLKSFKAHVAFMRSLVRVHLPVQNQLGIVFEHFSTRLARIFGQVR